MVNHHMPENKRRNSGLFPNWCAILAVSSWTAQAGPTQVYSHGEPTEFEQYMLEMVNRARLDPTGEASRYGIDLNEGPPQTLISSAPKQPLAFNPHLLDSARQHSQWLLANNTFSHIGVGGSTPGGRMTAAGYVFSGSWANGENLAWNGTNGVVDVSASIRMNHEDLFVDTSEDGRGHRINLLNGRFREIGIGAEEGPFTTGGLTYNSLMITQDFGQTDANPASFLVGVVYQDRDGDGLYSPGEGLAGVSVMPAQGTYYAVTSASGGFAIPLDATSGALTVTVSQGPLSTPITKTVQLTGQNVKLDFETLHDTPSVTPVRLGVPRLLADGRFAMSVSGTTGQSVALQASADLVNWQSVQTLTLTSPQTDVFDSPPAWAPQRFYRVLGQ